MYKRLSAILFPITALFLIGSVVWGYQENKEKNTVLIKAENQYQRAFHDLSFHMDKLHSELGNTVAVNASSQNFYRKELVNMWRMTSEAQNDIGQLPLALVPFSKTQAFLDQIAKFTYHTSVRDLSTSPMSETEKANLNTLYERSKEINAELKKMQTHILAKNLRWMDVETALASQKENTDNAIIDGIKTIDKKVEGYTAMNWGPSVTDTARNRNLNRLPGAEITMDQAKQKAAQFFGLPDISVIHATENGKGTDYNTYTLSTVKPGTQDEMSMDVAKKGGEVLFYTNSRPVASKTLDVRGARDAAQEFLDHHKLPNFTPVAYDEANNVASLTFARVQDDVIVYPEKLTVNVALDNGEVIDMQATDYVLEHKDRKLGKMAVSMEKAKKELNPKFEVLAHDQALIKNELNEEVLCHQFLGRINGTSYKIYINGESGGEEKIETLRASDVHAAS